MVGTQLKMTTVGSFHAAADALRNGCTALDLRPAHQDPDDTFRNALFTYGHQLTEISFYLQPRYFGDWCVNLRRLCVTNARFDDEFISKCAHLEHLCITSQDKLQNIAHCPKLESLDIYASEFMDICIARCKNLRSLTVRQITDAEHLYQLSNIMHYCPTITTLRLVFTYEIDNMSMDDLLAKCAHLRVFSITGSYSSWELSPYLPRFTALEELTMECFDEGIYKLPKLRKLTIHRTLDASINFSLLPSLEELDISGVLCNLDMSSIRESMTALRAVLSNIYSVGSLAKCTHMTELRLMCTTNNYSCKRLANALTNMKQLRVLVIEQSHMGCDDVTAIAKQLPASLTHFSTAGTVIGELGTKHLTAALAKMKGIEILDLSQSIFCRKAAKYLARGFQRWPNLVSLTINYANLDDDLCLLMAKQLHHCKKLEVLSLKGNCMGTTASHALALAMADFTRLRQVYMPMCDTIAEVLPVHGSQMTLDFGDFGSRNDAEISAFVTKLGGHAPVCVNVVLEDRATVDVIGRHLPFLHPESSINDGGATILGWFFWQRRRYIHASLFAFMNAENSKCAAGDFVRRDGDRAILHRVALWLVPV